MRIRDPKLAALRSLEVLRDLPDRQLRLLAERADEVVVDRHGILIHQDQLNRHAYFLVSGSVGIDVDGRRVASVTAGSIVGERTAFEPGLANATVTALEPTRVLAVDHRVLLGAASRTEALDAELRSLADERTNRAA